MIGHKHLVMCRCILQQFASKPNPPQHHFVVFSVLDDSDKVIPSFVQCNNCGAIHKVVDICRSEITNKDDLKSLITIDELKNNIPEKIVSILEKYNVDLPTWQHVEFLVTNEKWGETVYLATDDVDGTIQGKALILLGKGLFKVESFMKDTMI